MLDYFRCAEALARVQLAGSLSEDSGYFAFGSEIICYGRSSSGFRSKRVGEPLYDALADVQADRGCIRLPMNPDEIVDNLRNERYACDESRGSTPFGPGALVRSIYYRLRPFLSVAIRKHLQRVWLRDWNAIPFPRWPVDRTTEQLLERILVCVMRAQGLERIPFVWFWPDGAGSCAMMTHDVEQVAGRNFCSQLMDMDDSFGIKSSFELVPEQRYAIPVALLDEMRNRGFEIGIHDWNHDGDLFSNHKDFLRRAEQINAYGRQFGALGFRSGGLYRNQAWYGALEFSYDMSVPAVAHLDPQRGGCCSLMPFFVGRILELPVTTIQDYSLLHILNDYSIDRWKQQLREITEHHGLASFIVHPDYIIEGRARRTYQLLLEHLTQLRSTLKVWIALPREVDRWWRARNQMVVVPDGRGWRVEGPGRERARVAFAALTGDTLAYSVEDNQ